VNPRPLEPQSVADGDDPDRPFTSPHLTGRVLAAGAICWRPGPDGELELLLVHSARWGDWSWPKGKLESGETQPEAAVREVTEETGVRPELGVPLPTVSYFLPDGRPKTVRYWAARVLTEGARTAPADEIDDVAWLPATAALQRLTRPADLAPGRALLDLAERGRLDTRPLLVLRHAKARGRANWPGAEADRPLTGTGLRQARAATGLLACWAPERLLCSPWARCRHTLDPYLSRSPRPDQAAPELLPLLSEDGLHHPDRIDALVAEVLAGRVGVLLCTHRPLLARMVQALAAVTDGPAVQRLPRADPWLAPAEMLVAHVSEQRVAQTVTHRIHSVEKYRGESSRKIRRPN
jgi:8-oxo-dGTP pyrophosphatase MutT (NUDIX family)/phosphohistidine phosphatase SixA